jgi:hypothetical protein
LHRQQSGSLRRRRDVRADPLERQPVVRIPAGVPGEPGRSRREPGCSQRPWMLRPGCLLHRRLREVPRPGPASTLWACVLRPSDRTLRWARTICGGQAPPTTCVDYFVGLGSANAGCYDVVWNCTVSDPPRCEGNVLLTCGTYPALIDGKAVFDWDRFDCSQNGQVCRTPPSYGPGCWPAG